jgi:hypothetical protein
VDQPPTGTGRDLGRLLRGNCPAALAAAGTALGVSVLLSLLTVLVSDPEGVSTWDELVASVALALGVFTIDGVVGARADGFEVGAHAGIVPLFVATLALGGAAVAFRRLSRGTARLGSALLDAARASVLLGALALLLSLVFRSGLESLRNDVSDVLGFLLGSSDGLEVGAGASRASSFFLAALVLMATLTVACLLRRDWLPARVQRVHDHLRAPLHGLAALVALLPVAGLVAYASLFTGELPDDASEDLGWNARIALGLAGVSNAGLHYLGIGVGGSVGTTSRFEDDGGEADRDAQWSRLSGIADESDMWGLWFSVPLVLVVLALAAWVVVRSSRATGRALPGLLVWCGTMFVAFPVLARLGSLHGSARLESGDDFGAGSMFIGMPFASSLLLALVGTAVALLVGVLTGAIDVRDLDTRPQAAPQQGGVPHHPGWRWDGQARQWVPDPSTLPSPPPPPGRSEG